MLVAVGIIAVIVGSWIYVASSGTPPTGSFWFPFPFFPLIFIPVFFLFFFGFRWFLWGGWGWGRGCYGQYYDPALATLRERFAKGEITKEALEQMTRDLEQ
jgi:uncharacterized membrane protein